MEAAEKGKELLINSLYKRQQTNGSLGASSVAKNKFLSEISTQRKLPV
jgi:hypothetical protein